MRSKRDWAIAGGTTLIAEMDELVERNTLRARQTLRKHEDKVEALVSELLAKEELNEEEVAAILGERLGQEG